MNATEKEILKLLKEGKSQNAIANELGVPRSLVQRVSDTELGVDPASLKSLTTDQIANIQRDSATGNASNAFLAKVYGVSAKTIARALMVRIEDQGNNVHVISPIKEEDREVYEVLEGGTATTSDGREWYVGAYLENHNKYLCFRPTDVAGLPPEETHAFGQFFDKSELTACVSPNMDADVAQQLAELSAALVSGYEETGPINVVVRVAHSWEEKPSYADTYPLRGSLDARRRVGFFNASMGRTQRGSISSVLFTITDNEKAADAAVEKSTKADFSSKDLDVFLNKHQILILPESIVISIDGKPETITTSHQAYDRIVQAIKEQDIKLAYELMKPREAIKKYVSGAVSIDGRSVKWNEYSIAGTSVAKRALELALKGDYKNLDRLSKFMDKMYQNPSAELVQSGRIYEFMAYSDVEIDDDGDIILYKSVRGNYMDKHSNTVSNAPGTIVRMARSFVNDNNTDLCSYGLHVCSLAYLKQCFGSLGQRVVRCKLNPKDIVSITNDYKSSKIRCCEYLVLDDYTAEYNRQYKSIDVDGLYR